MMQFPHGETVEVVTPAIDADPYSGDTGTPGSSVIIPGVAVEPRPSGEPTQDARNQVVSGFTLYLPPDVSIDSHNRVIVRGETYNVIGEAAEWRNPFTGWQPGIVVQVERSEG